MKIGVFFNKNNKDGSRDYVKTVQSKAEKRGVECIIVTDVGDLDGLDVLLVLGGDGTILTIAAECAKRGVRIIGVNYGHLGFLAEFEPELIGIATDLILKGDFETQRRSMLEVEFGGKTYDALNDVVIQRITSGTNFSNTINLKAYIDGSLVDNFTADGLIISTPTGSTAYSLSAGGSVLTPDIDAFIMTPVCAHSLHSRPIVYNDNSVVSVTPLGNKAPLNLIVDGKVVNTVDNGQSVTIKKSPHVVDFIVRKDSNFFKKLLIKLNIWSK